MGVGDRLLDQRSDLLKLPGHFLAGLGVLGGEGLLHGLVDVGVLDGLVDGRPDRCQLAVEIRPLLRRHAPAEERGRLPVGVWQPLQGPGRARGLTAVQLLGQAGRDRVTGAGLAGGDVARRRRIVRHGVVRHLAGGHDAEHGGRSRWPGRQGRKGRGGDGGRGRRGGRGARGALLGKLEVRDRLGVAARAGAGLIVIVAQCELIDPPRGRPALHVALSRRGLGRRRGGRSGFGKLRRGRRLRWRCRDFGHARPGEGEGGGGGAAEKDELEGIQGGGSGADGVG